MSIKPELEISTQAQIVPWPMKSVPRLVALKDAVRSYKTSVRVSHTYSAASKNLLKPTGYVQQQVKCLIIVHSAHTVFMCFVFISE